MVKTYLFLVGAIFFEVAGTMLLPVTQNFTKLIPTIFLTIFYLSAFYLLTFVVNKLPIAIVYATWSGLGIFTISILGYIFFKQTLAWQAIVGLFLIVIGVVLMSIFITTSFFFSRAKLSAQVSARAEPARVEPPPGRRRASQLPERGRRHRG